MADAAHNLNEAPDAVARVPSDDQPESCDWQALAIELVSKVTTRRVRWDLLDGAQVTRLVEELANAESIESMRAIIDRLPAEATSAAPIAEPNDHEPSGDDSDEQDDEAIGPMLMGKPVKLVASGHWSRFHDVPDKDWKVWKFSHQGGGKMVRF